MGGPLLRLHYDASRHPADDRNGGARLLCAVARLRFCPSRWHVASAEDALSEAFLAALQQWPTAGSAMQPEAWLLTTARRRLMDAQRRQDTRLNATGCLDPRSGGRAGRGGCRTAFPDERLKLLFVCAHPAIDPAARTPLMLQMVLGVEAQPHRLRLSPPRLRR